MLLKQNRQPLTTNLGVKTDYIVRSEYLTPLYITSYNIIMLQSFVCIVMKKYHLIKGVILFAIAHVQLAIITNSEMLSLNTPKKNVHIQQHRTLLHTYIK